MKNINIIQIVCCILTMQIVCILHVSAQNNSALEIQRVKVATKGLPNPERGFRFQITVGIEDGEGKPLGYNWPFAYYKDEGVVMAQAYCYLSKYFDSDISQSKLDALQADFDHARQDGVKFVLRFAYQSVMDGAKNTPSLERILSHIKQLTPIVRKNVDVIYVLQVGWLGAWGEFHSDPNGLDRDPKVVRAILDATLDMLPPTRSTMVRRMAYRDMAEAVEGVGALDVSRIGFFNDGTMASYTDGNTFIRTEDGEPEFDKVTRESSNLPVEGELFWGAVPNLVHANALSTLDRFIKHHYTTFSIVHSNTELDISEPDKNGSEKKYSIDAWKATPFSASMLKAHCLPCDENYFKRNPLPSGYEYIRDHLGYRLEAVRHEGKLENGIYNGNVSIRNVGFSRPVNSRMVYLVLFNNRSGAVYEFETNVDARSFEPWKEIKVSLQGKLPDSAPKGKYRAALWIPDMESSIRYRPEYAITLAEGVEVVELGGRLLNVLP